MNLLFRLKPPPIPMKSFSDDMAAKEKRAYTSGEGLKVLPDYTFDNCPSLHTLVIPGSMNPEDQTGDQHLVSFVKKQNGSAAYVASHCAGAFILGASGIANGRKLVTYCGGGEVLQSNYPDLLVQDDEITKTVRDGRIFSSNGGLVSYLGSLDLLETLTSAEHRQYVEGELLINRLK